MTVLIGFSFPDLTVLGADGRGVAIDDPQDVRDDMQKIFKTGFGLVAGNSFSLPSSLPLSNHRATLGNCSILWIHFHGGDRQ